MHVYFCLCLSVFVFLLVLYPIAMYHFTDLLNKYILFINSYIGNGKKFVLVIMEIEFLNTEMEY